MVMGCAACDGCFAPAFGHSASGHLAFGHLAFGHLAFGQPSGIMPSGTSSLKGSLTKILVGTNRLGDEGAAILCNALRESKVTSVQELALQWNSIGPKGAKAVAAMAVVVGSMTRLDVTYNGLGDEGKAVLRKAIEGRSGFELLL